MSVKCETGKICYRSGHEAADLRGKMSRKASHRKRKSVDIYRCPLCKLWHLGRTKSL